MSAYVDYQLPSLSKLVKDSGVYALSSIVVPFISLVLAPFLTHHLSSSDYGILTLLNTAISLVAGITQLGLGSAFLRLYNYDYAVSSDKRDVIVTSVLLLMGISLLVAGGIAGIAPFLAHALLGHPSLSQLIILGGIVVLVQNLTIPGLAWLRAESRASFYSLLSIGNLLITLVANLFLIGVLHRGIDGSLIATGCGYACIVVCTLPLLLLRTGIRIRLDIARGLLAFGAPLVLNFVAYWILQLSDRYLLSHFSSFAETARYTVAYNLGSALMVVVITPFTLAWPTAMFTIAKHEHATRVFQVLFRWLNAFLLLSAFCLSIIATLLLNWLFPPLYRSAAPVIPMVAMSCVFFGLYYVFNIGINIQRKTWMLGVFTTISSIVNLLLNLILIPCYGAQGAALSTLVAYMVLSLLAYVVNQRIYPIAFELGRFGIASLIGCTLYVGSSFLAQHQGIYVALGIYAGSLIVYSGLFVILGKGGAIFRIKAPLTREAVQAEG
ncbi:flippase [Dictyobacter sp. S3.2.2.5]|uniref:Flippase n=1 Tax=Dictyobacter halimunensis TaxID=3026934 RepID=A0ABQ6FSG3_9CHLR|nr:flippase [Dictyobacter sp. S3.2.2.5]